MTDHVTTNRAIPDSVRSHRAIINVLPVHSSRCFHAIDYYDIEESQVFIVYKLIDSRDDDP